VLRQWSRTAGWEGRYSVVSWHASGVIAESIRDLIRAFENPDREANRATKDRLDARAREGLTVTECTELLRAATRDWERPPGKVIEPRDSLVWAAVENPHPELIDTVRDVYARLPNEYSRVGALRLLANIGTPSPNGRSLSWFCTTVARRGSRASGSRGGRAAVRRTTRCCSRTH
jgi:hypothetical protein